MIRFFRLVRGENWWFSKVPPLLALAYLCLLLEPLPAAAAYARLAALLLWAIGFAAYAHVINDWTDLEEDRRAGKTNRMAPLAPWARAALLAAAVAASLLPWLRRPLGGGTAALLATLYALPILYSVPPLRLKERGAWAVLADAGVAHLLPALCVFALFTSAAAPPVVARTALAAALWALCAGARGYLLGQMWDLDNDRRAGVRTLTAAVGIARVRRWIRRGLYPAEMLGLVALGLAARPAVASLLSLIGAALLLDLLKCRLVWRVELDPAPPHRGVYVPPHDLYQVWFPLWLSALLAVHDPRFLALPLLQVLLFYPDIRNRQIVPVLVALWRRALGSAQSRLPARS